MREFRLTSESFSPGEKIPHHFIYNDNGCVGDNVSPSLKWQGAPDETKSYAVTVFDPDAPKKDGWWHWSVINIPSDVTEILEGASNTHHLPEGASELITDFRGTAYGGPCPPKGSTHRYVFTVFALDISQIEIPPATHAREVQDKLLEHSLETASFTMKYGR